VPRPPPASPPRTYSEAEGSFEPAACFAGARAGRAFRRGPCGLGYYADASRPGVQPAAQHDTSGAAAQGGAAPPAAAPAPRQESCERQRSRATLDAGREVVRTRQGRCLPSDADSRPRPLAASHTPNGYPLPQSRPWDLSTVEYSPRQ
jgi:hypothetical protein